MSARLGDWLEAWLEAERGQLPLWLPVGLVVGVGAWFWLPSAAAWCGFLLATAAIGLAGLAFGRGGRVGRSIGLFAIACLLGCALIWVRADRAGGAMLARPQIARFAARIVQVEPLPARDATRLLLRPAGVAGLPPLVRVTVAQEDVPQGLMPGAIVTLRARLVPPPSAAVPGAYDYAAVAWFAGIGATGRALDPVKVAVPAARAALLCGWPTRGSRSPATFWRNSRAARAASPPRSSPATWAR